MGHKQLFSNNPIQDKMADAYAEMLTEEHEQGVENHTVNFFEDIDVSLNEDKWGAISLAKKYAQANKGQTDVEEAIRQAFLAGWKSCVDVKK